MKNTNHTYNYEASIKQKYLKLIFGIAICLVFLVADILIGPAWLTISETISSLLRQPDVSATTKVIVWTIRFPAALLALGVGAALGLSGAGMQTILDNPLASPYTLGISAGAGFGAALAIVTGASSLNIVGPYIVPVTAFSFAFLTSMVIYFIGRLKKLTPETMILTGIALSFLFQAMQSLLQYIASPEVLQSIVFWLFGSLSKATWFTVLIMFGALLVVLPFLMMDAWKLTALKLGDEKAVGLGVHVEKLRKKTFFLVSVLTGVAVSFVGIIGFIGLVGPHIARILVGEDQRFFIPLSAVSGAVILSSASILSKTIVPGAIIPLGIVTAIIGVPFFFSLIITKKRGYFK
jgi:iron complex transport system permease protein